jgi:hypothetical protein
MVSGIRAMEEPGYCFIRDAMAAKIFLDSAVYGADDRHYPQDWSIPEE